VGSGVTDVLVTGALGKMGALLCETVAAQDDLRLVARVDTRAGEAAGPAGAPLFSTVGEALNATRPQVAVDFTVPAAVFDTVGATLSAGVATVVSTTGLTGPQLDELSTLAREHSVPLLVVPNFALGAVLLMRFSVQAARYFPAAEIIELHEEHKVDAPSGTSLRTAQLMTEGGAAHPHGAAESRPSRGLAEGGVRIHSVRLPGLVAHQEVVFGGTGETLSIRHDSLSRDSFMGGALLAIRRVRGLQGTVVGLENLLDDTNDRPQEA
ncbi:MAG TPA: 4-hydroxy-tetrahydrodipicolinate reductase, partial [Thermoleophilia bacterium]|nr:4-hydroxy-tetrahydrodipicolinate reductase [Thermoleophilia bacterium]